MKATIYTIHPDREHRSLLLDLPEGDGDDVFFRALAGVSQLDSWSNPPVYIDELPKPAPDIWFLSSLMMLAFTPAVLERLEPYVSMAGELLRLTNHSTVDQDTEFEALNITNVIDAIDMRRSDLDELTIYPDFVSHRLGEPTLFTVPHLAGTKFCVDYDDQDDSLKRRIDSFGLTGLTFREVWSTEEGPRDINLMAW